MLRNSNLHGRTCSICAEICDRCADDCERFENDSVMYRFGGAGSSAVEGTPYTNPNYNSDDTPYGGGNGLPAFSYRDIGIAVLDEPIYLDEYAQLPEPNYVDSLRSKTPLDYVGYGVQEQVMTEPGKTPTTADQVPGNFVQSADYIRTAMNKGGGLGDPTLLGGTNMMLRVNSYVTNSNCAGVGYAARVDVPEVLSWIESFLE